METFMTELSSVIRNWPAARVKRTTDAAFADAAGADADEVMTDLPPRNLGKRSASSAG
jgi:hypothetical protein